MFASKVVLFAGFATSFVLAFQQQASPDPCTPNEACSYTYTGVTTDGDDVDVTATGFCNAVGECLGNGAVCTIDDECYNFCGTTTGTCGSAGATCYSNGPEVYGGDLLTCDQPAYVCSATCDDVDTANCDDPGVCALAPSQAAARMRKARRSERTSQSNSLEMMLRRAANVVARPGDEKMA